MNRREARELLFTLLYEAQFSAPDEAEQIYASAMRYREIEDDKYVRRAFFGARDHVSELDALIDKHIRGWKSDRVSRVTRAIMRLCVYEFLYEDGIPQTVSINEAVELSKKYDRDGSSSFVNGVLNTIYRELNADKFEEKQDGTSEGSPAAVKDVN